MRLRVEFPDGNEEYFLDADQEQLTIADILRRKGKPLNTRCGERDICGGCLIDLVEGQLAPNVQDDFIRGCQHRPASPEVSISVPARSMLAYAPQVVSSYRINVPLAHAPLVEYGVGAAIDIGTTTVVVQLVDLQMGAVLATKSAFNAQMHYGDDVLTRINLCLTDPAMLETLKAAITQTIRGLVSEALEEFGGAQVDCYVIAGNTTMLHLLVGADPSPMGVAPFTPEFVGHRELSSKCVGLDDHDVPVHLLPSAAAYIGADLVAGMFASGLAYDDGPSLLVDIGTNGEIILKADGKLLGCATAAGPAFEGCNLACGMRAGKGAISHIRLSPDLVVSREVIGGGKPTGICGSAYVDILAEGIRSGLLTSSGRFSREQTAVVEIDGKKSLRVGVGIGKRPIYVTEQDIARLLQAKAAIAAGIKILLKRAGLQPPQVKTLYLAGGFGMHLDIDNAITAGLLPGFTADQVELVGNTSLAGAFLTLLDESALPELERISTELQIVELNLDPEFEDTYIDELSLAT